MSYYMTDELRQKRREFLERRQDGIGGSDMPVILGLVKGKNALDIYHQKTRPIRDVDIMDDTIHQFRGHEQEKLALNHYLKKSGRRGRALGEPVSHPDYPNVIVSPDGITFADESREHEWMRGTGVIEVKNPSSYVFGRVLDYGLRYSEIVQLQTEIAAAQYEWGTITYFNMEHNDGPCHYADQKADPFLGPFLLRHGQRFWDEHVAKGVEPDWREWSALLDDPEAPKIVDLSGEVVQVEDPEYREALRVALERKELLSDAEEAYETAKQTLHEMTLALGHRKVEVPGLGKATVVTNNGRTTLDTRRLEEHVPLNRDKFLAWATERGIALEYDDLERLKLDFEPYRTQGDPYQYTLTSRSKDV